MLGYATIKLRNTQQNIRGRREKVVQIVMRVVFPTACEKGSGSLTSSWAGNVGEGRSWAGEEGNGRLVGWLVGGASAKFDTSINLTFTHLLFLWKIAPARRWKNKLKNIMKMQWNIHRSNAVEYMLRWKKGDRRKICFLT